MIGINLGCGTNHLKGWNNFDSEVNIIKPLPFDSDSTDFILAEHVVEHVCYDDAISFFRECHRVLKPGGVARIAVPSIERIMSHGSQAYFDFASKWGPSADRRGAMHAILHSHGHRAPWTEGLLLASLYFAGFNQVNRRTPGQSYYQELKGVEGHGKVIGDEFNAIETVIAEGIKS